MSLLNICINRVTALLNKRDWSKINKDSESQNPFSSLPFTLVNQLLDAVVSEPKTLSLSYMYLLLTSGRITKFCLPRGTEIQCKQFIDIFNTLSDHAIHLKVLILKHSIEETEGLPDARNEIESAIDRLLLASPNLEIIQSVLSFDLKCIQQLLKLKKLDLPFIFEGSLYDMVPKIDDVYITNDIITYFRYSLGKERLDELVFILQHWVGLTYINSNIAYALEHLHGQELVDGTLTKRYKLEYILLEPDLGHVPSTLSIASITCPNVRHLVLYVPDKGAITSLCNFQNLEVLRIGYATTFPDKYVLGGDFQSDMKLVVQQIGGKLKRLEMIQIFNIDLSIISCCCENLGHLTIAGGSIFVSDKISCFEHLEDIILAVDTSKGVTKELILQLLPQCKNISSIKFNTSILDDDARKELSSLMARTKSFHIQHTQDK